MWGRRSVTIRAKLKTEEVINEVAVVRARGARYDQRTILVRTITMTRVKIYSTGTCPFCDKAKALLKKWQIPFDEVRIDLDDAGLREMQVVTNHARTVPQIVIDGKPIGGLDDLTELHMDGELKGLIPV